MIEGHSLLRCLTRDSSSSLCTSSSVHATSVASVHGARGRSLRGFPPVRNMINMRTFSLQRFKGTESVSKVSEQVKNVKLNEDKPKETKSEETLDEVCI